MSSEKLVHEVYRGAIKLLNDVGWCQHKLFTEDGKCCPLEALALQVDIVSDDPVLGLKYAKPLDDVLAEHTGDYRYSRQEAEEQESDTDSEAEVISGAIWRWNDRNGRTQEEVIKILEMAADTAEYEWLICTSYRFVGDIEEYLSAVTTGQRQVTVDLHSGAI